jgi:hypothetical protein
MLRPLQRLRMRGRQCREVVQIRTSRVFNCRGTPVSSSRTRWRLWALMMACAFSAHPVSAMTPAYADRMHARAVESFRLGRFPEAYGRFIPMANAGHPASARDALWMCEHGLPFFGSDWDCSPHESEEWARIACVSRPASPLISPSRRPVPRDFRDAEAVELGLRRS